MNALGKCAEDRALRWLQKQGLVLIERNWYCRCGEIDLVMKEGGVYVMVEVRYRKDTQFGGAMASLTHSKCRKLLRACQVYCQRKGLDQMPCRLDALLFEGEAAPPIWLKNILS
jgi:putative endonuclease